MSEYIDFEIAREYLHKACECLGGNGGLMLKIKFDEELKADVQEVVHGEWKSNNLFGFKIYDCSNCGIHMETRWNYCPHCGAKMDERSEDER